MAQRALKARSVRLQGCVVFTLAADRNDISSMHSAPKLKMLIHEQAVRDQTRQDSQDRCGPCIGVSAVLWSRSGKIRSLF